MIDLPLGWATQEAVAFLLVVARLSGLFLLAPVFSSRMIPVRIKLMALLVLAATMTPIALAQGDGGELPTEALPLALAMAQESLVGLALGFAVSLIFTAVQVGASLMDLGIGFAMAEIVDPATSARGSVLGAFYSMVVTLAFLAIGGAEALLQGFIGTYDAIGVGASVPMEAMLDNVITLVGQLFVMGFQIAAPVLITLLLADVVLGIVARTVPQMNVFFVGIPLKIGIGLVAVLIALPQTVGFFENRVSDVITGATALVSGEAGEATDGGAAQAPAAAPDGGG